MIKKTSFDSFIENNITPHVAIEFLTGSFYGGILMESDWYGKERNRIFESYGVFSGCEEIACDLLRHIDGKHKNGDVIKIPISDIFTDSIKINFTDSVKYMGYFSNGSVFSDTKQKFKTIQFFCNPNISDCDINVLPIIMHELQHAYEDYMLRIRGYSLQQRNIDYGLHKLNQANLSIDDLSSVLHLIFYFFYKVEKNAYITSMYGELIHNKTHFNTVSDVIDYLKKTISIQNYYFCFKKIEEIKNLTSERDKELCVQYANKFLKKKVVDFEGFIKWLEKKKYKVSKKLNTMIAKVAYEYFQDKMNTILPGFKNLSEMLKSN